MFRWKLCKATILSVGLIAWALPGLACTTDASPPLPSDLAASELLLDARASGSRLIAVGARGHVLISDDRARTWRQVVTPTDVLLTALWAGSGSQVWAVGHDSTILYSSDSGESWRCQHADESGGTPLFDIWFADAQRGLAVGAYGLLLQTRDGGKSWQRRRIGDEDHHFYALVESVSGLWLLGEGGVIWRSGDKGEHWRRIESAGRSSLFAGLGLDDGSVLLVGLRGRAVHCSSQSECRSLSLPSDASLFAVTRASSGRIHLAGEGGIHLLGDFDRGFRPAKPLDPRGVTTFLPLTDGRLLSLGGGGIGELIEREAGR